MLTDADRAIIIAELRDKVNQHYQRAGEYRHTSPAIRDAHLAEANKLGEIIDRLQPEE